MPSADSITFRPRDRPDFDDKDTACKSPAQRLPEHRSALPGELTEPTSLTHSPGHLPGGAKSTPCATARPTSLRLGPEKRGVCGVSLEPGPGIKPK